MNARSPQPAARADATAASGATSARRIAAILLLGPELDANYRRTTSKTEPLAATLAAAPASAKPRKASRRKSQNQAI